MHISTEPYGSYNMVISVFEFRTLFRGGGVGNPSLGQSPSMSYFWGMGKIQNIL